MEVKLRKLVGIQDSPIGPVETESMDVWRVDVFDPGLPNGMLHIGTIGRHDGANFCANHSFDEFTIEQKNEIVLAIKSQHGNASPDPPVELPPSMVMEDDDEDEDDYEELEEDEEIDTTLE